MYFPASYLTDVAVTVSNVEPPPVSNYDLDHYPWKRCGQFYGTPQDASVMTISCNNTQAIGRYVYIYLERENYMNLCEVEVFGECK